MMNRYTGFHLTRAASAKFPIVAIGASAGGLDAIGKVLAPLPADFPAPIIVVQHRAPVPHGDGRLADLLSLRTALRVQLARYEDELQAGTVYVGPPDWHLLVSPRNTLALSSGPRVRFVRPSIDLLFESVATGFGERSIGVILTGRLDDGTRGAQRIKAMGGRVLVQEPDTAYAPGMPSAAIRSGAIDFVLPLDAMSNALVTLLMASGAASLFRVPEPTAAPLLIPYFATG